MLLSLLHTKADDCTSAFLDHSRSRLQRRILQVTEEEGGDDDIDGVD
jgi:hypothetical protein